MKIKKELLDLSHEFVVWVPDDRPGIGHITLCGLCGNSGILGGGRGFRFTSGHFDVYCPPRPCICPNGREGIRQGFFAKPNLDEIFRKPGEATGEVISWSIIPAGLKPYSKPYETAEVVTTLKAVTDQFTGYDFRFITGKNEGWGCSILGNVENRLTLAGVPPCPPVARDRFEIPKPTVKVVFP
jgi:hypothetical protein